MSLGAAAMSMAGSNPEAEHLSEEAKRAFEAKDYQKSVDCYAAAAQLAPTCAAPHVLCSRCCRAAHAALALRRQTF